MNMLKKILTIGTIILFIGINIQPAFAIDTKQSIVNKEDEEDCDCKEISNAELIKMERLIDRAEIYSKLLILSSFKIELLDVYEELSNDITILFEIYKGIKPNSSIKDFPIICGLLKSMLLQINDTCWNIVELIFKYESIYPTLTIVLGLMLWILAMTIEPLVYLSVFLDCKF